VQPGETNIEPVKAGKQIADEQKGKQAAVEPAIQRRRAIAILDRDDSGRASPYERVPVATVFMCVDRQDGL
jgi:hypothetical protein